MEVRMLLRVLVVSLLLACSAARAADGAKPSGTTTTWPAPAGVKGSADYKVFVNGHEVFVYETGVHFQLENRNKKVGYGIFDADGPVELKVICAKPVKTAVVRPVALGIKARVEGNEILFRMEKPAKVTVDVDGRTEGGLILFGGEPEKDVPKKGDPNVIWFGPGVHEIKANVYSVLGVESGQTIYVAGGAILRGRILGDGVKNVRICGRGIIDGSTLASRWPEDLWQAVGAKKYEHRPPFVDFRESENVRVEGVCLIDSPMWTLRFQECRDLAALDLRMIGYVPNSDGIDVINSQKVRIADCFIRTADDAIVIKGYEGKKLNRRPMSVKDVEVERCVLWADRASALEIGHETEADEICDIAFRDIDILEQMEETIGYHAIDIHAGDEALVTGILYDNIRVENCARLVGMKVEKGLYNRSAKRGSIQDIAFTNVSSLKKRDVSLYGHSADHEIENVTFQRFSVGGKHVDPALFTNRFAGRVCAKADGPWHYVNRGFEEMQAFETVTLGASAMQDPLKGIGGDAKLAVGKLPVGKAELNGIPFDFAEKDQRVIVVGKEVAEVPVGKACKGVFVMHGWTGKDLPLDTELWRYELVLEDWTTVKAPVRMNRDVCKWDVWAAGGWVVKLNGKKFYVQAIENVGGKVVKSLRMIGPAKEGTGVVLGVTVGG
jgi:hypothetical protein